MQLLLSNSANLDERHPFRIMAASHYCGSKNGAVAKYWCRVAPEKGQMCPGCKKGGANEGACSHNRTMSADKYYKVVKITCEGKRKRAHKSRIGDDSYDALFGSHVPRKRQQPSEWTRPPRAHRPSQPGCLFPLHSGEVADTLSTTVGGQPEAHEVCHPDSVSGGSPMPSALTIISYNTDGCAGKRLAEILSFAAEEKADVVLLQDIASQRWSPAHLQKMGWALYQHDKVGIMLRIATADRHVSRTDSEGKPRERVWRSATHLLRKDLLNS